MPCGLSVLSCGMFVGADSGPSVAKDDVTKVGHPVSMLTLRRPEFVRLF